MLPCPYPRVGCLAVVVLMLLLLSSLRAFMVTASVVHVDCGSTDDVVVQSSMTYVLNCTQPQPGYRSFVEAAGGTTSSSNLSHVAVHAVGGNTLPRWVMDGGGSVENVSLRLANLYTPGRAAADGAEPSLPLLATSLFRVSNCSWMVGVHISLENVTLHLASSLSAGGLFTVGPERDASPSPGGGGADGERAPMRNVSFSIANSSIAYNLTADRVYHDNGPSLLYVAHHGNLSGLGIRVVGSELTGTGVVSGFLINIRDGKDFLSKVEVDVRSSTIRQTWSLCASGDPSDCFVDLITAQAGLLDVVTDRQDDIRIAVSDVNWRASMASFAAPHRISNQILMIRVAAFNVLQSFILRIEGVQAEMHATHEAHLVVVRIPSAGTAVVVGLEVHLTLKHVDASMWLGGAAIANFHTTRAASVLRLYTARAGIGTPAIRGLIISLTDVTATSQVVSGETNEAAVADSSMISAGAQLLFIAADTHNASIGFLRCHLHGTVTGGTVPQYISVRIVRSNCLTDDVVL